MKRLNSILLATLFCGSFVFQSCQKDSTNEENQNSNIIPNAFKVDIPSSLSNDLSTNKKGTKGESLDGADVYKHLNTFIAVGEGAADVVQAIIKGITKHNINKAMSLSFEGDDDARTKKLDVYEGVAFEGVNYEFQLNIADAASSDQADGGLALQVFWSRNPVKGIAILKPYNLDRLHNDSLMTDVMYRVDYSEAGQNGYEKEMTVYLSNLPLADPTVEPYAMSALKMWVGKNGDHIDVTGNSDHPNATLLSSNTGFDWAFVASSKTSLDVAIAEVGLPANTLDASTRSVLLDDNSMLNVFTAEAQTAYPGATPEMVALYYPDIEAPGYFDKTGFVQAKTAPNTQYEGLEARIEMLTPFNPKDVSTLSVAFKN